MAEATSFLLASTRELFSAIPLQALEGPVQSRCHPLYTSGVTLRGVAPNPDSSDG